VTAACAPPPEARTVIDGAEATTVALAVDTGLLAEGVRSLAAVQSGAILRVARERVAADLARVRTTITPDAPTDADLGTPDTPWARALDAEVAALRARLDAAPLEDRPRLAASLEDAYAATIDLALATPGFTPPRVLRDAAALDALNAQIEAEPDDAVRAALLARRDALLDPYAPARSARPLAGALTRAADTLAASATDASRAARTQAAALGAWSRAPAAGPAGAALGVYRDAHLREALLDLVARADGPAAASRLRDRLTRADAALDALSTTPR
jgi:hypothetical protein